MRHWIRSNIDSPYLVPERSELQGESRADASEIQDPSRLRHPTEGYTVFYDTLVSEHAATEPTTSQPQQISAKSTGESKEEPTNGSEVRIVGLQSIVEVGIYLIQ